MPRKLALLCDSWAWRLQCCLLGRSWHQISLAAFTQKSQCAVHCWLPCLVWACCFLHLFIKGSCTEASISLSCRKDAKSKTGQQSTTDKISDTVGQKVRARSQMFDDALPYPKTLLVTDSALLLATDSGDKACSQEHRQPVDVHTEMNVFAWFQVKILIPSVNHS